MAGKLVLCRHGQSDWNLKNLFTGWTDVDLTEKGIEEAKEAGRTVAALDYAWRLVRQWGLRGVWIPASPGIRPSTVTSAIGSVGCSITATERLPERR